MNIRYIVTLNEDERASLAALTAGGKVAARKLKRAQILLAADARHGDEEIAEVVGVGTSTVYRTKKDFVEGNLDLAREEKARPGGRRKLSGKEEALLVATACSSPPAGRARWTLELLAGEIVRLTEHGELSRETVRRRLEPIPAKPGQLGRYDYEYRRNGTANLFVFLDAHRPWRHIKLTDRRAAVDFAACMRELVDVHYPKADRIRVVLDNLSTHSMGALYEAFTPDEARRILSRLEFHYTPKHASWLNMVEIEIGVLKGQCLDRRIGDRERLEAEIAAWVQQRNEAGARIRWMFTTAVARTKMGKAYPAPAASPPPALRATSPSGGGHAIPI